MAKRTNKGSKEKQRVQLHQPVAPQIGRVQYKEVKMPNGKRCARVVPGETLGMAAFVQRLCDRNLGLSPKMAKFYLEAAFEELAACLREGKFVTFEGIAHFGSSIKGTLTSGERQLNATHALRPWAHFLTPFFNEVNAGAYLAPLGQLPAWVSVTRVTAQGRLLTVEGHFRSPEAVGFSLVVAGSEAAIPCEVVAADTSATRHECTYVQLRAAADFPPSAVLHACYVDASGTEQAVDAVLAPPSAP